MNTHAQTQSRSFADRILGVLKLHRDTYEEIGASPDAMPQAMMVVAVAALGNAVAETGPNGVGALGGAITVLIGWVAASVATWLMGSMFANGETNYTFDRLLRIIGFAFAPVGLMVLSPVPIVGIIAVVAVAILSLLVIVTAVRVGIQVTTGKAIITLIAAAIGAGLVSMIILETLGVTQTTA